MIFRALCKLDSFSRKIRMTSSKSGSSIFRSRIGVWEVIILKASKRSADDNEWSNERAPKGIFRFGEMINSLVSGIILSLLPKDQLLCDKFGNYEQVARNREERCRLFNPYSDFNEFMNN